MWQLHCDFSLLNVSFPDTVQIVRVCQLCIGLIGGNRRTLAWSVFVRFLSIRLPHAVSGPQSSDGQRHPLWICDGCNAPSTPSIDFILSPGIIPVWWMIRHWTVNHPGEHSLWATELFNCSPANFEYRYYQTYWAGWTWSYVRLYFTGCVLSSTKGCRSNRIVWPEPTFCLWN